MEIGCMPNDPNLFGRELANQELTRLKLKIRLCNEQEHSISTKQPKTVSSPAVGLEPCPLHGQIWS